MLRLKDSQLTIWDAILPAELLVLKEELAKVDAVLDDETFMATFIARSTPESVGPLYLSKLTCG